MKSEKKRSGPRRKRRERIIDGLGVSLGIAIGPAHVMEAGSVDIPEYVVEEDKLKAELERFADAVEKSQRQLRKLKTKSADLPGAAAEEEEVLYECPNCHGVVKEDDTSCPHCQVVFEA